MHAHYAQSQSKDMHRHVLPLVLVAVAVVAATLAGALGMPSSSHNQVGRALTRSALQLEPNRYGLADITLAPTTPKPALVPVDISGSMSVVSGAGEAMVWTERLQSP